MSTNDQDLMAQLLLPQTAPAPAAAPEAPESEPPHRCSSTPPPDIPCRELKPLPESGKYYPDGCWEDQMRKKYGHEAYEKWREFDFIYGDDLLIERHRRVREIMEEQGQPVDKEKDDRECAEELERRKPERVIYRQEWKLMAEFREKQGEDILFTEEQVLKNIEDLKQEVFVELRAIEGELKANPYLMDRNEPCPGPFRRFPRITNDMIAARASRQARREAERQRIIERGMARQAMQDIQDQIDAVNQLNEPVLGPPVIYPADPAEVVPERGEPAPYFFPPGHEPPGPGEPRREFQLIGNRVARVLPNGDFLLNGRVIENPNR